MAEITRQFPRAPSIYGQRFIDQKELILDLVHDTYKHCYFKDCEVIIPETHRTLVTQSLFDCQFDDCQITIIQRHPFDLPYNKNRRQRDMIVTPIPAHIDVKMMPDRNVNLTTIWLSNEIKEKLGMVRTMNVMRSLSGYAKLLSHRNR